MQVFRSANEQREFPPGSAQRRITSVQYDGPSMSRAVVVWSVGFIELAGAVQTFGGVLVRKSVGPSAEVAVQVSLLPRLVGSRGDVGGTVLLDLVPGDVLEFVGFLDTVGSFALAARGFELVIL